VTGLDEITLGGLPRGRPTLICGSAGCGKTLFGMEFLLRGALDFDEPGVFMAFEETEKDLSENVRSLGFDLDRLVAQNKIAVDYVHVERSEIQETGEYQSGDPARRAAAPLPLAEGQGRRRGHHRRAR
jgi:circadian clock protein KaiC